MAQYKAKMPIFAPIKTESDGASATYDKGIVLGKMMSLNLTPNFNEASLYGDDAQAEYEKEFKDLDVSLNTTFLPAEAYQAMFGSTVTTGTSGKGSAITSNIGDTAKYGGLGCVITEKENGTAKYWVVWLPKVKFAPPGGTYQTKGENITWNTPTISGKGTADNKGDWKILEAYDTEAAAITALKTKAGITTA